MGCLQHSYKLELLSCFDRKCWLAEILLEVHVYFSKIPRDFLSISQIFSPFFLSLPFELALLL